MCMYSIDDYFFFLNIYIYMYKHACTPDFGLKAIILPGTLEVGTYNLSVVANQL